MARIRSLKPRFLDDEKLHSNPIHPAETAILMEGLWLLADREGRLNDSPRMLKGNVLKFYDHISPREVDGMLAYLDGAGLIVRYQAAGEKYIQIANWRRDQTPHKTERESEIPPPPENVRTNLVETTEKVHTSTDKSAQVMGFGILGNGSGGSSTRAREGQPATSEAADLDAFAQQIIETFAEAFPDEAISIPDATALADGFLSQCKDNPRSTFLAFARRLMVTPNARDKPVAYALQVARNRNLLQFATSDPIQPRRNRAGPRSARDYEPDFEAMRKEGTA